MTEPMKPIYIYDNLKNWDFDIHSYPMPKAEADMVMELIQKSLEQKNTEDNLK